MLRLFIVCFWLLLISNPVWARTWTSSSGTYRVEAQFVEYVRGNVVLKKKDGTTISVPLAKLSEADKKFVAEQTRIRGGEEAIRKGLAKRVSVDFQKTPLYGTIRVLRRQSRTAIFLDQRALANAGIRYNTPVTVKKDASLRQALDLMLEPLKLTWDVKHDVIRITTKEQSAANVVAVIYQLSANAPAGKLVESIQTTVAPKSWDEAGGRGSLVVLGRALVIAQTRAVHEQIAKAFKKQMRPLPRGTEASLTPKLGQETQIELLETPLTDAVALLQDLHEIEIEIDEKAFAAAGVNVKKILVTMDLRGVRLQSALGLMLSNADESLTWTVDGKRLIITTQEAAEKKLISKAYQVRDFVVGGNLDLLLEVITTSLVPDSWNANGGLASVRAGPAAGTITVAQTVQAHLEIDRFLKNLRQLGR